MSPLSCRGRGRSGGLETRGRRDYGWTPTGIRKTRTIEEYMAHNDMKQAETSYEGFLRMLKMLTIASVVVAIIAVLLITS
jgi:hypothetical protein